MIEIRSEESIHFPVKRLVEIRDRFSYFLKPFMDRENEESRERLTEIMKVIRSKMKQLKELETQINEIKQKFERVKLCQAITENLVFILKNRFLTAQQKEEIKTITLKLKTMSLEQLVKQDKKLVEMKLKLVKNFRR